MLIKAVFLVLFMIISSLNGKSIKGSRIPFFADQIEVTANRYGSNIFENGEIKKPEVSFPAVPQESQLNPKIDLKQFDIIEGDILVRKTDKRAKRKIVNEIDRGTGNHRRWPFKTVVYEIDPAMSSDMIKRIGDAISHWETNTCIKFEVYDINRHASYKSKLLFLPSDICGSLVGYTEEQSMFINTVYLSKDCTFGSTVHELGHTIGFYHEHSRIDRDNHININFNKLIDFNLKSQYDIQPNGQPGYYGVQYDLFSIMHYSSSNGLLTALDTRRSFLMGQRLGLSFLDIKLANLAYKCSESCPNKPQCQNEGFVSQNCKCVCPDSFTGDLCEKVINAGSNNLNMISQDNMNFDCDFENNDLCSWIQDQYRASNEWSFPKPEYKGLTETQYFMMTRDSTFKTGPQNTNNEKPTKYIYLNSLRKQLPNANAVLSTPQISLSTTFYGCLEFNYHMYKGDNNSPVRPIQIGNLSVYTTDSTGSKNVLWSTSGNHGSSWKLASVDIVLAPPISTISIEAQLVGYNYGDIAIDNIKLRKQKCISVRRPVQLKKPNIEWGEWSNCSVSCGSGIQTRNRICTDEDIDCKAQETRPCVMPNCPNYWTEWNEWSNCSAQCGKGYHYRVRLCLQERSKCIGESVEYEDCFLKSCDENSTNALNLTVEKPKRESSNIDIFYDESSPNCGGTFILSSYPNKKISLQSPNYPNQYDPNLRCNYYLKSPPNTIITIKIVDVDLEASATKSCIDGIEFRYFSLGQPGPIFCGSTLMSNTPTEIKSYSNFTLAIFRSNFGPSKRRRGFSFEASYA